MTRVPMSRAFLRGARLSALFLSLLASGAHAGVGDRAAEAFCAGTRWSPIERNQYYAFEGDNYCWYSDGWQGPGWYWCGYEWDDGLGWGGPYGWNGWGGGYSIRRHARHGVGVWRPGAPSPSHRAGGVSAARRFGAGGAGSSHRLGAVGALERPGPHDGVPANPAVSGGAAPAFHGAGGGGGLHGFGAPASAGFRGGGAPAFHGAGGGGFQSFGGAGGFHGGGGGAFSFSGGHGGGHR